MWKGIIKLIFVLLCVLGIVFFLTWAKSEASAGPTVINGQPVPAGEHLETIDIQTGNAGCSASIIGPRAMLTAAHCARTGSTSKFTVAGKSYTAKITRHPEYPNKDWDMSLGLIDRDVEGVSPVDVWDGTVKVGDKIKILGYGCTQPGGSGGNDGVLRFGYTKVTGFTTYDIVSKEAGGAALCYGDSGGPVFMEVRGAYEQIAVNSKGNIKDTNYTTNLSVSKTRDFMKKWAEDNSTDICGITKDCGGGPAPEKFSIENAACKVEVESKGLFEVEYLKTYFTYLMLYLSDSTKHVLPIIEGGVIPSGFCSCGNGFMAVCDYRKVGECNNDKWCFCEGH